VEFFFSLWNTELSFSAKRTGWIVIWDNLTFSTSPGRYGRISETVVLKLECSFWIYGVRQTHLRVIRWRTTIIGPNFFYSDPAENSIRGCVRENRRDISYMVWEVISTAVRKSGDSTDRTFWIFIPYLKSYLIWTTQLASLSFSLIIIKWLRCIHAWDQTILILLITWTQQD